ncbi:hypothetical protein [Corynebacterium sp.]|uniref:hypothetical protein n=1 Tax=Corynebacterium sp. TaxID=1720 RepID=UPI0027B8B3CE|nr:hypothetical protein [Corynebacterium sp.]
MSESLEITAGGPGLRALLSRAVGLDASASARFRVLSTDGDGGDLIDVFVTTPFDVVACRRIKGTVSRDGAVVAASTLLHSLETEQTHLGPARDTSWPGALPPTQGFQLVDNLPVHVVRELADKGRNLARQFSGPMGPPQSLLNQTVLTVHPGSSDEHADAAASELPGNSAGTEANSEPASTGQTESSAAHAGEEVEIPMRMIFACTNLGLIPGFSAPMDIPRHLRVSANGRWSRVDAPFGSVYHSRGLSVLF